MFLPTVPTNTAGVGILGRSSLSFTCFKIVIILSRPKDSPIDGTTPFVPSLSIRVFQGAEDFVASASAVTISNGVVYHTTTDGIYAFDLSGQGYHCSSKSASKSAPKSVVSKSVDSLELVKAYE